MSAAGASGANVVVENRDRPTRSFQRSIPERNIEAARLSHPASAVVAAMPKISLRLVIELATASPGYHRENRSRMQSDQHDVSCREEPEQNQTREMHHARGIVAAK